MRLLCGSSSSLLLLLQHVVLVCDATGPRSILLLTETGECGVAACGSGCGEGPACPQPPSVSCQLGSPVATQAAAWLTDRLRQLTLTNTSTGQLYTVGNQNQLSLENTGHPVSGQNAYNVAE